MRGAQAVFSRNVHVAQLRQLELVSTCLIDTVTVIFDVLIIVTRHPSWVTRHTALCVVTLIDQENRPNLVVICCRFSHLDRDRDKL